jgi:hypothetical protein
MIFGILLPFAALVVVGGLLALILIRHEIGEVKGLWQTTGSKSPPKVLNEKPSPQELKPQYKPYRQSTPSTREEHPPANVNEGNQEVSHPWRW